MITAVFCFFVGIVIGVVGIGMYSILTDDTSDIED
jgi:hypothetical protein